MTFNPDPMSRRRSICTICLPSARRTLCLVFALGLASCDSAPENLLLPVSGTAPGASAVDMLVATTRRSTTDPGDLYSGERGGALTFADVVVSIPPDSVRAAGDVQRPSRPPGNPATDFVTAKVSRLDPEGAPWPDLRGMAASRHRVLIFVHGYNTRVGDAVFRFAQLVHDADATATPNSVDLALARQRVR